MLLSIAAVQQQYSRRSSGGSGGGGGGGASLETAAVSVGHLACMRVTKIFEACVSKQSRVFAIQKMYTKFFHSS